jgi:hypothetical protein
LCGRTALTHARVHAQASWRPRRSRRRSMHTSTL